MNETLRDASSMGGRLSGVPVELLPASEAALIGGRSFNSCAVVGNSGSLLLAEYGKEVDDHSVVFRVNQAPAGGRYARHVGTRTDFRLLNAKWSATYALAQKRCPLQLPFAAE
jgi:hypothetical protein